MKKSSHASTDEKTLLVNEWSVPLTRAHGHGFVDIARPNLIFFTPAQSENVHRQFDHPSADKLHKLLKIARPEEAR